MIDTAELEGKLEAEAARAAEALGAKHVVLIGFWVDEDGRTIAGDGGTAPLPMVEVYAQLFQQYGGVAYFLTRKPQPVPPPPMADASNAPS
jgi:hypothetical protein